VSEAEAWLRARLQEAPGALLEAMISALPAGDAPVPEALAEAAATLYEEVARGPQHRAAALPLLAADALLTHAIEAQAGLGPEKLDECLARWGGGGRIGSIALGAG
jgi:hypothetical protein